LFCKKNVNNILNIKRSCKVVSTRRSTELSLPLHLNYPCPTKGDMVSKISGIAEEWGRLLNGVY
jgi:hypothetical protein